MEVSWKVNLSGQSNKETHDCAESFTVGRIHVNNVDRLASIDIDESDIFNSEVRNLDGVNAEDLFKLGDDEISSEQDEFDQAFVLSDASVSSQHKPYGKICLVYSSNFVDLNEPTLPSIYFRYTHPQTKLVTWALMARSFTAYFRLMVQHLGIFGWQVSKCSGIRIPHSTRTWLNIYARINSSSRRESVKPLFEPQEFSLALVERQVKEIQDERIQEAEVSYIATSIRLKQPSSASTLTPTSRRFSSWA